MSYRDALRNAEEIGKHTNGATAARLGVVVSHIGGRVQAIREKGPGPLLETSLREIESLCRAMVGLEDPDDG